MAIGGQNPGQADGGLIERVEVAVRDVNRKNELGRVKQLCRRTWMKQSSVKVLACKKRGCAKTTYYDTYLVTSR